MNQQEVDQWLGRCRQLWNQGRHEDAVMQLLETQPDYQSLSFFHGKDQETVQPYDRLYDHACEFFVGLRRKLIFPQVYKDYIARVQIRCLDIYAWTLVGGPALAARECDLSESDCERYTIYARDVLIRFPKYYATLRSKVDLFTDLTKIEERCAAERLGRSHSAL